MRHELQRQERRPSPQPSPGRTGRGGQTAILLSVVIASAAHAAVPPAPTPENIDKAIARGVAFLYTMQQPDGTWNAGNPPPPGPLKVPSDDRDASADNNQWGNQTALAVYALLQAGESPTDPRLKKAIDWMRTTPTVSTSVLSVRCQIWSDLPPTPEIRAALRRDASALLQQKKLNTAKFLVWDYANFSPPRPGRYTLGATQNAAWGLWAAGATDFEVPPDVWKQIEKTYEAGQLPDGSWANTIPVKTPGKVTVFSTATAVSALFLAQDYSRADAYGTPRGNPTNPAIDKGVAWLSGRVEEIKEDAKSTTENASRRWYGLGAVALASGRRKLGDHDWYLNGAADLLAKQFQRDGRWGQIYSNGNDYRVNDTAWSVLFLQRGRVPVAMNKLDYSPGATDLKTALWNQRPRDAANAVRWIARTTERDLRWQSVDTNDTVAAMLEAPVLYIAGGDALDLKADAKEKLKQYVEHGGLIFAAADAGNSAFNKSLEKLAVELFPGNEWRDVPDTHPIFATQMFKRSAFKAKPTLRAIGNGVREFVVLAPSGDPARTWQQRSGRINTDAWQLAANVLSYAVDKSHFFPRGQSWLAKGTADVPQRSLRLARLKYNGPWDPEPQAFAQFTKYAQYRDLGLKINAVKAGDAIKDADVLYVTGTGAFTFDDKTRDAIKTYMDGGGRVIFEAAGGSGAFAASAQAELGRWYGADALKLLPASHKLYSEKLKIAYRGYNIVSIDKPSDPQLLAVEKDGRVVALLSREDLSAGLLGVPTDGITGYTPESARALLLSVLSKWK